MWVSDQAVNKAAEEVIVNREKRRAIQRMSPEDLTLYLVRIYRLGFEDGASAIEDAARQQQEEDIQVDWEDVLKLISQVRGVGPKLTAAIDKKLREEY